MKGKKIKNLVSRLKYTYETEDPLEILCRYGVKVIGVDLEKDMEYFEGAYISNEKLDMVLYNNALQHQYKKVVLWHESGHVFRHGKCYTKSITKDILSVEGKYEKEADLFAAEALIDDDTFLDYLKFYRYTDTQIASDLNIPVKYVRLKYQNFDKSKLL